MNGLLLVNKPAGITSHDVVVRLRRAADIRRIGHAGTLDPFATGLMLVLLGRATRLSQFFLAMRKEYRLRLRLGEESDTLDVTGKIVRRTPVQVSEDQFRQALALFLGEIQQIPPMFSAVKMGGRKLYEMARRGLTVDRAPRAVSITQLQILCLNLPEAEILLQCSSGTYVRSLVHDLGRALGCGALVTQLCRTAVGPYRLNEALALPEREGMSPPGAGGVSPVAEDAGTGWKSAVISPDELLQEIPGRVVSGTEIERIRHGQDLARVGADQAGWVRLLDPERRLVAMGVVQETAVHPRIVLV